MVSSFYLKRFLSVRDFFFFFLIMKTRFSKDDRYIFGKKKKKRLTRVICHQRTVLIANIWPAWTRTLLFRTIYEEIISIFNTYCYFFLLCPLAYIRITAFHLCLWAFLYLSPQRLLTSTLQRYCTFLPKVPSPWCVLSSCNISAFHLNGSSLVFHFQERRIVILFPKLSIVAVK